MPGTLPPPLLAQERWLQLLAQDRRPAVWPPPEPTPGHSSRVRGGRSWPEAGGSATGLALTAAAVLGGSSSSSSSGSDASRSSREGSRDGALGEASPALAVDTDGQHVVLELQQLLQGNWQPSAATKATLLAAPAATADVQAMAVPRAPSPSHSPDLVRQALACNVVVQAQEDAAVVALQELEAGQAVCGLWPEFSLLNHSCAANTVVVEEVDLPSAADLLHHRVLQWVLDRVFGVGRFRAWTASIPQLLVRTQQLLATDLESAVREAIASSQRVEERRQWVRRRLNAAIYVIELGLKDLKLNKEGELMLFASVFELLQLQLEFNELVPDRVDPAYQLRALQRAVQVMGVVGRGSEPHLVLLVQYLNRCQLLHGSQSPQAVQAALWLSSALKVRYGPVDAELMKDLVQVWQRRVVADSMVQRMGILATDMSHASTATELEEQVAAWSEATQ
ncbi:hypothetical protein QJQ45_004956 [Haematococcus lacustris]|nr:hypothetical protein QJQ45_004956 [Haematococcus lacustris]